MSARSQASLKRGRAAMSAAPAPSPALAAQAAAADSASSGSRTRGKRAKNLNEGKLAESQENGLRASDEAQALIDLRAFWGQFDTPLLLAWIVEWDEYKPRKIIAFDTPRDDLLSLLVQRKDDYRAPRAEVAAEELDRCLQRVGAKYPEIRLPPPVAVVAQSSLAAASPAPARPNTNRGRSSGNPAVEREAKRLALQSQLADLDRDVIDGMDEDPPIPATIRGRTRPAAEDSFGMSPVHRDLAPSFAAVSSGAAPLSSFCLTCAEPRPASTLDRPLWRCVCGLRGDVPADDPANIRLAALSATPSSSSASAGSAPLFGQKDTDTSSRLDKEFDRQARAEPESFPVFDARSIADPSLAALAVRTALAEARMALGASRYKPPSKSLINLIQKGKLRNIGHAMPRLSLPSTALNAEDTSIGIIFKSDGSMSEVSKEGLNPPVIPDISMWATTLHAVILPALAAQSGAQTEWLTLSLTMEALTRTEGWAFAREYCDLLLQFRVPQAQGFKQVSDEVLRDLRASHRPGRDPPAKTQLEAGARVKGEKRAQSVGIRTPASVTAIPHTCNDWNKGSCTRDPCRFQHKCKECSGQHRATECPKSKAASSVITEAAAAAAKGK